MIKKLIYIALVGTLMIGSLAGCKKEDAKVDKEDLTTQQTATEVDVPAQTVADTLLTEGVFKEELAAVDYNMALTRLYILDSEKIEDAVFYTSSGATAEEVVVIKVKDEEYMETVKDSFDTRIADQIEAYTDYVPEEVPKLEDAVIYTNGCYGILCVSGDKAKIDAAIANIFE